MYERRFQRIKLRAQRWEFGKELADSEKNDSFFVDEVGQDDSGWPGRLGGCPSVHSRRKARGAGLSTNYKEGNAEICENSTDATTNAMELPATSLPNAAIQIRHV